MSKRMLTSSLWRWIIAAAYLLMVIVVGVYEFKARTLLLHAGQQAHEEQIGSAQRTLEQLVLRYPLAMSVPPAREALSRLAPRDQPIATPPSALHELHPLRVDWLPLVGWPTCGLALSCICLTRLGRRNGWAIAALALAIIAMVGTLVTWAWYGFSAGQWLGPVVTMLADPLLSNPQRLYLATWAMIAVTAAMMLCPLVRPVSEQEERPKARPDSPNDPRLALAYLDAQKAEHKFNNIEYARRREAILMQI